MACAINPAMPSDPKVYSDYDNHLLRWSSNDHCTRHNNNSNMNGMGYIHCPTEGQHPTDAGPMPLNSHFSTETQM